MSHLLPIDQMKQELQTAMSEYRAASEMLDRKQGQLEQEMITAFEKRKIEALKRKLAV